MKEINSDIKTLYRFLRERNIIKNPTHSEYEPEEPENPAESLEKQGKNRAEYLNWKSGLSEKDLSDFNFIFNE